MFRKGSSKQSSQIGSLIGVGTTIIGDVRFAGGMRVDGEIKGNVSAADAQDSTLVLGEHARVEGELSVSRLFINGTVIGSTISSEFLELQSQAQVLGDVHYNVIEIHGGAVVQGELVCRGGQTADAQPATAVAKADVKMPASNWSAAACAGDY
ncbi:MAG: polymer-forming cytoskeletal protein [Rhodocyclaceae bacterium]|nr:polymer-forming cytoskeletal protein [Rhodocyclaceae bacterium]